ncbi:MAG: hypothetical protein MUF29_01890 [Chitinophagaceae bacterium]|jgi:hypothetical protein|nr:hypothetical protein [Chitinophagaceae bacterium]
MRLRLLFPLCILLQTIPCLVNAQEASFKVMISANQLRPGDTLHMVAQYAVGDRKLPPATFVLTLLGPQNKLWQMRWPMLEGMSEASIVWPDSIAEGRYNMLFAVQPRFLKFYGQVIYPERPGTLTARWGNIWPPQTQEIKPDPSGRFEIEQVYFEDNVELAFQHSNSREPAPPMIKLDAWLDSSYQPAATGVAQVVVTRDDKAPLVPDRLRKDSVFAGGFDMMVAGYANRRLYNQLQQLDTLQQYDSLYVPYMFRTQPSRLLACLHDSLRNFSSSYELLQQYIPEAGVTGWYGMDAAYQRVAQESPALQQLANETMLQAGKKWYRIYYQGRYGDPAVLSLPAGALAMIKIFEPPFYKIPKTSHVFGTIAFFERRYPLGSEFPYYHRFRVWGYTPEVVTLPLN